jgi:peptidoglycan/LPS O-acetylase OafA/YrhL
MASVSTLPDHADPTSEDRRFYRPELDVLRLLAFLLVFVHHGGLGFFGSHSKLSIIEEACGAGLQLFFLLSSYLITELLLREREETGLIHLRAFFTRRILRIWPLYFFFIGLSLLISKTTNFRVLTNSQFLAYLFLAGNWWTALHGFIPTIAGPLWTISIEEQYYIVWPFIGRCGFRVGFWITSIFCLLLSTGTLIYLGHHLAPRRAVWCNSLVEFQFFAAGAILALVLHGRDFTPARWLRPVFFVGAATSILVAQARFHIVSEFAVGPLSLLVGYGLLTVGVVLLFLGFYRAKLPPAAIPVIYLGKISYGLYVFHYLSIRFTVSLTHRVHAFFPVAAIAALAICIGLAMLSYRIIELPFLSLKRRFTFVRSRVD